MKEKKLGNAPEFDWSLSEEELTGTLINHESSPLLFGVIEGEVVLSELRELGSLSKIEARGYRDFRVDKTTHVQYGDRFILWATHNSDNEDYMLFDIRTRFAEIDWGELRIRALFWEWLGFQDPKGSFEPGKPALPGQDFPGLGVFRSCTKIMRRHIGDTDADAIVAIPEYFHNAWLYSRTFQFYDPRVEGEFRALVRDLKSMGLSAASHAIHDGRVKKDDGKPLKWEPHHQVFPLTPETQVHFKTNDYERIAGAFEECTRYSVTAPTTGA